MTARDELFHCVAGAFIDKDRANGPIDAYRAELAEEFAAALLAVDPVEWALAGQHAGADAAKLIRRLAAASTADHSCGNCAAVDPDTCLTNPQRAEKEA